MSVPCCRAPAFTPRRSLSGISSNTLRSSDKLGQTSWGRLGANSRRMRGGSGEATAASLPKFESLDSQPKERVRLYVEALLQWKQKMNLTALREAGEVMERHLEDSLAIVPALCDSCSSFCNGSKGNLRLVDVDSQVTLLESMEKRCTFLEHAVTINELKNVKVVHGRAEDLGHNLEFRECFDVAVARAVAEMRFLGFDEVKTAGRAIQLMGGSVLKVCTVESSSPYGQRTAIICLKERPTPRRYPRDPGHRQKNLL